MFLIDTFSLTIPVLVAMSVLPSVEFLYVASLAYVLYVYPFPTPGSFKAFLRLSDID